MDRRSLLILLLIFTTNAQAQILREENFTRMSDESLAHARIDGFKQLITTWADSIETDNVLGEYPRPIMQRDEWMNLNGYWDFALVDSGAVCPEVFEEKILVPFPVESYLSGIQDSVLHYNELWYHRTFTVPDEWKGRNVILHFGAVDWRADVWVNGTHMTCHEGGYTAFSIDITDVLNDSVQDLMVKVWDPSDHVDQPAGKQCIHPGTIWYTASSGIWQTVWLEPVADKHFSRIVTTPDYDNAKILIHTDTDGKTQDCDIKVRVMFDDMVVATAEGSASDTLSVSMPEDFYPWTPDNPWLYDIDIELTMNDSVIDEIRTYTAMRKLSIGKSSWGTKTLLLNNEPIFLYGPLDQGYWPDGLYTAPTDEAMLYDLQMTKRLGFNMTRKHLKVEPARWYTYCDRIGLLVMQDMPSGGESVAVDNRLPTKTDYNRRTEESAAIYMRELKDIMDQLMSYPCICTWVLFNEGMGQFNTKEVTQWAKSYDPQRWIDAASGGNYYYCGDMIDSHHYPSPFINTSSRNYVTVIGEFGGLGLKVDGHTWEENTWSYSNFQDKSQLQFYYELYSSYLYNLKYSGVCAAVYTQLTDVEDETNGIMTYDRKVLKFDESKMYMNNQMIINLRSNNIEVADNN